MGKENLLIVQQLVRALLATGIAKEKPDMLFIFGWGRYTRTDYGPTFHFTCPHCHNTSFWRLCHEKVWCTVFCIPLFPYASKHCLRCDVCSRSLELVGSQIAKAKQLNKVTTAYLNKEITDEQYNLLYDHTQV